MIFIWFLVGAFAYFILRWMAKNVETRLSEYADYRPVLNWTNGTAILTAVACGFGGFIAFVFIFVIALINMSDRNTRLKGSDKNWLNKQSKF